MSEPMTRKRLDVRALYNAMDLVRVHGDLSWRDVSRLTGLPPSTFSRIGQGARPDVDSLCTIIAWLRAPIDRFVVDDPEEAQVST